MQHEFSLEKLKKQVKLKIQFREKMLQMIQKKEDLQSGKITDKENIITNYDVYSENNVPEKLNQNEKIVFSSKQLTTPQLISQSKNTPSKTKRKTSQEVIVETIKKYDIKPPHIKSNSILSKFPSILFIFYQIFSILRKRFYSNFLRKLIYQ